MKEKVRQIAMNFFHTTLTSCNREQTNFKILLMFNNDDIQKPLYIVGNAHSNYEDGSLIAILNPDEKILPKIHPGCFYGKATLKKIIQNKCDIMIELHIENRDSFTILSSYESRKERPASFIIE